MERRGGCRFNIEENYVIGSRNAPQRPATGKLIVHANKVPLYRGEASNVYVDRLAVGITAQKLPSHESWSGFDSRGATIRSDESQSTASDYGIFFQTTSCDIFKLNLP